MTVHYDIKDDTLRAKAEVATEVFRKDVVSGPDESLTANWQLSNIRGRPLLTMRLKGSIGDEKTAEFSPEDMLREDYLRSRFYRLWDAFLSSQIDHMIKRINASLDESLATQG